MQVNLVDPNNSRTFIWALDEVINYSKIQDFDVISLLFGLFSSHDLQRTFIT